MIPTVTRTNKQMGSENDKSLRRIKNRRNAAAKRSRPLSPACRAASAEFIADSVANLKDVVFRTDAQGLWQYLNPAWTEVTGFSVAESLGVSFLDFVHPDDRERNLRLFAPMIARTKEYCRHEVRYLTKGGDYCWIEVYARLTLSAADEVVGTSGTLTDITERVAARNALEESRSRLASIIESSLDCIVSIDRNESILEFNAAAERTFGYKREQVLGQKMSELLVPPSMREMHKNGFARFLATGSGPNLGKILEIPALRADGSEFITETVLSVDETHEGKPIFTAYMRDISDRKKAEAERAQAMAALEEANTFRKHITDTAPFLIYVFDVVAKRTVYVNEQVTAMVGHTPDAVYEMANCLKCLLTHPDDMPRLKEHIARLHKLRPNGDFAELEYRMRHTNGEWRWFRSRDTVFRTTPEGKTLQIIGVAEDITDARAAAEELRLSQERYEVAVNGTTDGIWDWDIAANTAYLSPRGEAILGYEPGEIPMSMDWWQNAMHPDDRAEAADEFQAYLMGKTNIYRAEYRIRRNNGDYRWVLARGIALRHADGTPYRMAGSLTDISDRRAAEEREQALTTELQRSNRELGDFASVVSHDLQEPLRKIRMFGDLLRESAEGELSDDDRDYLNRIQNAASRMQTLICDLLTFARLGTKAKPPVIVDLNTIVQEVAGDLEARLAETGGKITLCDRMPLVLADPLQMRQLFQNLLGNALKFHRDGVPPQITLHTCVHTVRRDDRSASLVQITVTDNGIGFSPKYAPQIFEVFQRLHAMGQYEGTGMGLAICRKIVERHGGTITANSVPDGGATFTLTLRAAATSSSLKGFSGENI